MAYRYMAISKDGLQTKGVLDVASEEAAERALWQRELTILDLKPIRRQLELAHWFPTLFGPRSRDIILFSRHLATLIDSGVPILSALQLLSTQINNRSLSRTVNQMEDDVHMGSSISKAMSKHPAAFSHLYCRMVEVGERSGDLAAVLQKMADYMEQTQVTLSKIRAAMSYPSFILTMAVFVILILINVTLPPMVRLFQDFGAELPWPTVLLMGITRFVSEHGLKLAIALALLGTLGFVYAQQPSGRRRFHRLMLRLPMLGKVSIHGAVARLTRTLSILLQAGVALPEALELSRQTVGNLVLQGALESVRQDALQGHGLSSPLGRVRYFPRMLSYLVRIGEETGTLDEHLATAADYYEKEVDRALTMMTRVLEPALIILVGLIVGFIAVSIILPMYDLLGAIK